MHSKQMLKSAEKQRRIWCENPNA